jgi:hypothetical protein
MAAVDTLRILEEQQVSAMIAVKYFHDNRVIIPPRPTIWFPLHIAGA